MKQMILKIDDDLTPEELPGVIISQGQMVGTKSYYNKILILVLSSYEPDAIKDLFECSVLAVEGEKIDQEPILKFMMPWRAIDNEGNEIDPIPETDMTGRIQTIAGHHWLY